MRGCGDAGMRKTTTASGSVCLPRPCCCASLISPSPHPRASIDRLERRHDLVPLRLEERREHHLLAERRHVLVHAEAGAVGRDLEQDSVRLAEVETAEPVAVDLAA